MKTINYCSVVCCGILLMMALSQGMGDPSHLLEECPRHLPQAGCFWRRVWGCQCPGVPDSQCVVDGCNGCRNVHFDKNNRRLTKEECNACSPFGLRDCDSCAQTMCPSNPTARCENRRCNTCKAVFYGIDREEIKSCCKQEKCQDGSHKFQCLVDPCTIASCPAVPKARCVADYCGGCKARFYYPNSDVEIEEYRCAGLIEECPRHMPQAMCLIHVFGKCMGQTCPNYPEAECYVDGCGGCNTLFFKGAKRLTYEDCNGCPGNERRVEGCEDPCLGATCPKYPDARCEPQTCGECKARFFGPDRKEITDCTLGHTPANSCPEHTHPVTCLEEPCASHSCPGVPGAVCRSSTCGGCKAEFFYPGDEKMQIPDYACVQESCPRDLPQARCPFAMCDTKTHCPMYPDAHCQLDGCNGCKAVFYQGRRRLTDEDCNGCPADKPKKECGNPCENALCPHFPTARCEPRVCGECRAVFYGLNRREIKDCCRSDGDTL